MKEQMNIQVVPHPFSAERVTKTVDAESTIQEMLACAQPDPLLRRYAHVFVDGHYIPRDQWDKTIPAKNAQVSLRLVPMGGGGKNPLRTVLSLAVMAVVPVLTGVLTSLPGVMALGKTFTSMISAGVGMLGRMAVSALAPPGKQRALSAKESPTLFIQAARNDIRPFGRVPRVLGRHRMVPPMAALPYTETVGNDQYVRMLFCWGYGPLEISDLRIGDTPLAEFDDIEVQTREGYDDDAPITLFTNSVSQNDLHVKLTKQAGNIVRLSAPDADEISVDITFPRGLVKFGSSGDKNTASVQIGVHYRRVGTLEWSAGAESFKPIAAQVAFIPEKPNGTLARIGTFLAVQYHRVVMDAATGALRVLTAPVFRQGRDKGQPQQPSVPQGYHKIALIERRSDHGQAVLAQHITDERDRRLFGVELQNASSFVPGPSLLGDRINISAGGLKFPGLFVSAKQSMALRRSVSFRVPKGQYEIMLRRITADSTDDNTFDETVWSALRTVRYVQPVKMKGVAMTALRIRATDQLNGPVDRFNGIVHSVLPDWTGEEWVEQPTSNPASLFREVLQGRANARPLPDNRLDLARLQEWHERCDEAKRSFDAVIDYDASVRDVLSDVAAAGRASPTVIDGRWSVVEDRPQHVPVQHFTPRNSFGFQGEKIFEDRPHALRVRFVNKDKGWQQDERLVFDDGYDELTAEKYEVLDLPGVTSADQAWRDGRYHIAVARLRPESFSFSADVEHIVCTRGDLIRFSHDVPLFGLTTGRVKQVVLEEDAIVGVELDERVERVDGRRYAVRFRKQDGSSVVAALADDQGAVDSILVFQTPLAIEQGPEVGDLAMFGESGTESVELIVKSITPRADMTARLTCVAAARAVHQADVGVIPAFSSQMTVPEEFRRPPAPLLAQIQSGKEALVRNADGSITSRVLITLVPPPSFESLRTDVIARGTHETVFRAVNSENAGKNTIALSDVEEGETYDFRVRYVSRYGVISEPLLINGHRVEGASAVPEDVQDFSITTSGSTAHLNWMAVNDIDLAGYQIRFAPRVIGVEWGAATDLIMRVPRDATSATVPALAGTYLIKAIDAGERRSLNAAKAVSMVSGQDGYNQVMVVEDHLDNDVGFINTMFFNDALILQGNDGVDQWDDVDAVDNFDVGRGGFVEAGLYNFAETIDLGAAYTTRITVDLDVSGLDIAGVVDVWQSIDAMEDFDQQADPSLWEVRVMMRTTSDDPQDPQAQWSLWTPLIVGDCTARGLQFRILMKSFESAVSPALHAVAVYIDMPDRMIGEHELLAQDLGREVVFEKAFRETPAVAIAGHDLLAGDYYTITNVTPEKFFIRFFDANGTGVERTFDYMAKGFGIRH